MSEADQLRYPGDRLQSSASRLAEWVRTQDAPYEVAMAAIEAQRAVEEWTEARRAAYLERGGRDYSITGNGWTH